MALIKNETYPVYKRGAPVSSEDLNKSNEITQEALNHIHENVQEVLDEYHLGHLNGATFTPYYEAGALKWSNNQGLTNPNPFVINTAVFTPSVSAAGVLSWTNSGGYANPAPVNIKGPQGDATSGIEWTKILSKPTTLSGYGITNAYNKTEVDNLLAAMQTQINNLTTQLNNLSATVSTKMPNTRLTVSTSNPSGGADGDVWIKVV